MTAFFSGFKALTVIALSACLPDAVLRQVDRKLANRVHQVKEDFVEILGKQLQNIDVYSKALGVQVCANVFLRSHICYENSN